MKNSKGITLIALIITIVILLILAVVAINAVSGDGIIAHAQNAVTSYNEAQTNEQVLLDSYLETLKEHDKSSETKTFVVTKYSTVGTDIASVVYFEFYDDNTCKYADGEAVYNGTYTYDKENSIINLSYEYGDETIEEQYSYTTIGNNNVLYYSYYDEKANASYIKIFSTDSTTEGILETFENLKYSYQTAEGYTWYINFEGDEIYWSTEDVTQENFGNRWLRGTHEKYFYFIDGYVYEYDSAGVLFVRRAKISDDGETLEQYMQMNEGYDGTWEKVVE